MDTGNGGVYVGSQRKTREKRPYERRTSKVQFAEVLILR
jgi:hypothetical protein